MLSKKDNFLETLKPNGKPDRLVRQWEAVTMVPGDPVNFYVRGERYPGMAPTKDKWGTTILWPAGEPGAVPDPRQRVIEDVTEWQDYTKVPDLIANCSDAALWEPYLERAAQVDRKDTLLMMFAPTGLFERLHFLMGFEDTLCNFMLEPEAMADLAAAIGEYRYNGFKLMVDNVHPDIILSHDDWGSKTNLFIQPELWREFIKANYVKSYNYLHDNGVLIMHHSDSFCEPVVEDMIDLHIDIWQGVLPQNDIVKLQEQTKGRLTFMGGIDAAIVDRNDSTEEEIRAEVRRACETYSAAGHFIPCLTNGGPGAIHPDVDRFMDDEIDRFNREHFGVNG